VLAIEDAGKAHQHPKIEQYGEALFVVARTTQMIDGRIAFGETHLFVGRGYVVSAVQVRLPSSLPIIGAART
jgi:magnesium transporter